MDPDLNLSSEGEAEETDLANTSKFTLDEDLLEEEEREAFQGAFAAARRGAASVFAPSLNVPVALAEAVKAVAARGDKLEQLADGSYSVLGRDGITKVRGLRFVGSKDDLGQKADSNMPLLQPPVPRQQEPLMPPPPPPMLPPVAEGTQVLQSEEPLEDSSGFQLSLREQRKAQKQAFREARRQQREIDFAEFFAGGGTHEKLDRLLAGPVSEKQPQQQQYPPGGASRKRKTHAPGTPSPSGLTPQSKLQRPSASPAVGSSQVRPAVDFAAATAQNLRARQEANRRERDSQYVLFVHPGKLNRCPMEQPMFGRFHAAITGSVLTNAISAQPTLLEVLHTSWSMKAKAGVIHCANEVTQKWFIQAVNDLKITERDGSELTFRAWQASEPDMDTAHINVKGLGLEHDQVLSLIKAYNPWIAGGITATRGEYRLGRVTGDPLMELHLTDEAAVTLATRGLPWRLYLGLETRMVVYHHCAGLAMRLDATNHSLAGQFRAGLQVTQQQTPDEVMDTTRAVVPEGGATGASS
jgi:hypothetical protein